MFITGTSARRPLAIALASALFVNLQAQQPLPIAAQACQQSLFDRPAREAPEAAAAKDMSFVVRSRNEPDGNRQSHYFTADSLVLNAQTTRSLLGTVQKPRTLVRSITFDARVVEIDGPLVFDTADVRILADTVRFTNRGFISLTAPPQTGGDGLSILTRELDLASARRRPFAFVTSDPSWHRSTQRLLSIVATSLKSKQGTFDAARLSQLTLDQLVMEDEALEEAIGRYRLNIDPAAASAAYTQALSRSMLWPRQAASQISRLFARAPFDSANRAFLLDRVETLRSAFEGTEQRAALASLDKTASLLTSNADHLGFNRYYVPRRTFTTLLNELDGDRKRLMSLLEAWDKVIVGAHSSSARIDAKALERVETDLEGTIALRESLQTEIDNAVREIAVLEQAVGGFDESIRQRQEAVRQAFEDEQRKNANAAAIKGVAKIVAVAAAFLPVAAPVAIGIATFVDASGRVVADHQVGQSASLRSVVLTLQESQEKAKEFRAKAASVRTAWDTTKQALNGYRSATSDDAKKQAVDSLRTSGSAFYDEVKGLYEGLALPTTPQLKLNDYEQADARLQALIKQVGELRTKESEQLTILGVKQRELENAVAKRLEFDAHRDEILRLRPENDEEQARAEALAWSIRQEIVANLAVKVAIIKRAFRYHTTLALDDSLTDDYFVSLYFPLSQRSATEVDAEKFFFGGEGAELARELGDQRAKLDLALRTVHSDAQEGFNKYKLGITAWQEVATEFTFSCGKNDARCRFIEAVNKNIEHQVNKMFARSSVAADTVQIPLHIPAGASARPRRLVDVAVSVKFKNPASLQGKTVLVSIVHPLYGQLKVGPGCFTVDMRDRAATTNEQEFTTTCTGKGDCSRIFTLTRRDYIAENEELVFMPLQSTYGLRIEVQDASTRTVPVIDRIVLSYRFLS